MIYDSERGTAYEYADGLIGRRSPTKRISQSGNTAGKHPLWMAADAKRAVASGKPVYLIEGEKRCRHIASTRLCRCNRSGRRRQLRRETGS